MDPLSAIRPSSSTRPGPKAASSPRKMRIRRRNAEEVASVSALLLLPFRAFGRRSIRTPRESQTEKLRYLSRLPPHFLTDGGGERPAKGKNAHRQAARADPVVTPRCHCPSVGQHDGLDVPRRTPHARVSLWRDDPILVPVREQQRIESPEHSDGPVRFAGGVWQGRADRPRARKAARSDRCRLSVTGASSSARAPAQRRPSAA